MSYHTCQIWYGDIHMRFLTNYFRYQYYRIRASYDYHTRRQFSRAVICIGAAGLLGSGVGLGLLAMNTSAAIAGLSGLATSIITGMGALYQFTRYLHPAMKYQTATVIESFSKDKAKEHSAILQRLNKAKNADIKEIKADLKALFNLRSHYKISDKEFSKMGDTIFKRFDTLARTITKSSDWELPDVKKQLKDIAISEVLYSHALLAHLENDMKKSKESITPENISGRLTLQGMAGRLMRDNSSKKYRLYNNQFMGNGIIAFYHTLRSRSWFANDQLLSPPSDTPKAIKAAHTKGSELNECRQIYNTFVKHGFYARYGNKKLRDQLDRDDSRHEKFTRRESKKLLNVDTDDGGFMPRPY